MKAKHFKKIRERAKYFYVVQSSGLFGEFHKGISRFSDDKDLTEGERVLAYDELQAAKRFWKRYHSKFTEPTERTSGDFGLFRVVSFDKPFQRFVEYFF